MTPTAGNILWELLHHSVMHAGMHLAKHARDHRHSVPVDYFAMPVNTWKRFTGISFIVDEDGVITPTEEFKEKQYLWSKAS